MQKIHSESSWTFLAYLMQTNLVNLLCRVALPSKGRQLSPVRFIEPDMRDSDIILFYMHDIANRLGQSLQ